MLITKHIGRIRLSVSTVNRTYELSGITHVTLFPKYGKHSTGPSTYGPWVRTYSKSFSCKPVLTVCSYRAQSNEIFTYGEVSRGSVPRVRRYGLLYLRAVEYDHCLHEIGWANAGVTTPIPLWVRNTGRPVDVPWFRWALSNRVPSSCPVRRIPRQDPLHTTEWESLTNRWYRIIPKDKVKAESLLITEHSSNTSMCINNASLFLAYQAINWWQNSVHILLILNDDSLFITYINYIASDNLWYLK